MVIRGEKVVLRPVRPEDIPKILTWDDDDEVVRYLQKRFPAPRSNQEVHAKLKGDGRKVVFGIETLRGTLIGDIGLHQISWRGRTAELRICIGQKEYWNLGYGSDSVRTLLRYSFERLGLESVYLRVYLSNRRAIRCYEKCGFRKKGLLKAGSRGADGFRDMMLMVARPSSAHRPEPEAAC